MNARRESAEILSYCKGDSCSRRRFPVEFNSIEIDTAEDFSDPPKLQTNPNAPARTGKLSLDVNRVTRRNLRGNIIAKNTLSRWQTGQRYGIISADGYKRGRFSPIEHQARRRYDACAFCSPQVWYNVSRQLQTRASRPEHIIKPGGGTTPARFARRRCGIMSADSYKRGHNSLIDHPAGRRYDACAFCSPQARGQRKVFYEDSYDTCKRRRTARR